MGCDRVSDHLAELEKQLNILTETLKKHGAPRTIVNRASDAILAVAWLREKKIR